MKIKGDAKLGKLNDEAANEALLSVGVVDIPDKELLKIAVSLEPGIVPGDQFDASSISSLDVGAIQVIDVACKQLVTKVNKKIARTVHFITLPFLIFMYKYIIFTMEI